MEKKKILFVCLGNICRSPAAEGIMRELVAARGLTGSFEIDSAGTYGGHAGEKADPRMRSAALDRGIELTHRSRKLTTDDFGVFDMIVVMDDSNYERACRIAPSTDGVAKVVRMTDYCRRYSADHIPDPYYEGAEGFEYVLDLLEDACGGLLDSLTSGEC